MRAILTLWAIRVRRDLVQLILWIAATTFLAALTVTGVSQSFGTAADRTQLLATAIANPVVLLFRGLPSGAETDQLTGFLILPFLVLLAGLMASFLAVRHTRGDEESGRAELVGGTTAGRHAPLWATVAHGTAALLVLAIGVSGGFLASGLAASGAVVAGVAVFGAGLAFFGISLVGAQLFATARAANTFGVCVIMGTFLLSGVGNALGTPDTDLTRMTSSWLSWLSPFGWAENTRPWADDLLWPAGIAIAVGVTAVIVAAVLDRVRDLSGSFIAERRGPAHAGATLRGPLTLALRLSWPAILAWSIGGAVVGVLATTLASLISDLTTKIPSVQAILQAMSQQADIAEGTVIVFFTMTGILASCCAVQIVTHARHEEAIGTVELVWSAAVSRRRWLASVVITGAIGIVAVIGAAALGAWIGLLTRGGDMHLMPAVLVTGSGQALAATVFLVIVALVLVLVPRATVILGWTILLLATILGLFGPLFGLPDALVRLSPVAIAPTLGTDGAVDLRDGLGLIAVAAAGLIIALWAVRRRELATDG